MVQQAAFASITSHRTSWGCPRFLDVMRQDQDAASASAELYDAVGALWLHLFGEHVHVGYYPDARLKQKVPWRTAQHAYVTRLMELGGVQAANKALDVGCGYGGTAMAVARQLQCCITGINISHYQVAAAQQLAKQAGFNPERVRFLVADGMAPPFPDGSFDLVISIESAAYMPDKRRFVQQLARLVAPGGKVLMGDLCRGSSSAAPPGPAQARVLQQMDAIFATHGPWTSAAGYQELMEEAGLRVTAVADWTRHVRGFWCLGWLELLLLGLPGGASTNGSKASTPPSPTAVLMRVLRTIWLLLAGGWGGVRMAALWASGQKYRVVQGGLESGALSYHVLAAEKPASSR